MNAVEDFVLSVDEERKDIVVYLHHLFIERLGLQPKLRYGLPFYDYKTWVCYLNPKRSGGVELVFLDGQILHDPNKILNPAGQSGCLGLLSIPYLIFPRKRLLRL